MLYLFCLFLVGSQAFMQWVRLHSLEFFTLMDSFSTRLSSSVCNLVDFSIAEIGVVFIPPVMRRRLAFWIFASLAVLVFVAVIHDVEAYSRCGRTAPV